MPSTTAFFDAFGSLLFGRAPRTARAQFKSQLPRADSISALREAFGLLVPDTASNQTAYPQPLPQKPGCGFPLMKVVGIFSLASGALLHFSRGTQYVHESQLFVKLWPHLLKGDVVLGDRGFCSFLALGSLLAKGVHSVMRLHQTRLVDFRRGKRLAKDDQLILWHRSPQRRTEHHPGKLAALPTTMTVRQIRPN